MQVCYKPFTTDVVASSIGLMKKENLYNLRKYQSKQIVGYNISLVFNSATLQIVAELSVVFSVTLQGAP